MSPLVVVGIHQPNFFPWLGYFNKIKQSDKFVFLDDAQFQKTGGVWTNRVEMASKEGPTWETVPIDRSRHGLQLVNEVRFKEYGAWRQKFQKSLESRYRMAPHFGEIYEFVGLLLGLEHEYISEFNLLTLSKICEQLEILTPTFKSSSLPVDTTGSRRLCALTAAVGGTAYLSGTGSSGYLEPELFRKEGISLRFQTFDETAYPQQGTKQFAPGLSVLDALMNVGWEVTRKLVSDKSS